MRYAATIAQSGENAPSPNVQDSTFDGEIIWTRAGMGQYFGTLPDAFPVGTILIISPPKIVDPSAGLLFADIHREDDNTVKIQTGQHSFEGGYSGYADDVLNPAYPCSILIEVLANN